MAHYWTIKSALDTALSQLTGLPVIVWEGIPYEPSGHDDIVLRPTIVPGISDLAEFIGTQRENGIYQIDLISLSQVAVRTSLSILDDIYDYFKSNRVLQLDGLTIFIGAVSRLPLEVTEKNNTVSIQINYVCYV